MAVLSGHMLYVFTLFDFKTGRPRCTGIKDGDRVILRDLFRPGAGKSINSIDNNKKLIRKIILAANMQCRPVVLSDFKAHLTAFQLPLDQRAYHVYDLHLPDIKPTSTQANDFEVIRRVLDRISKQKIHDYQRIIAESAVVYQNLEDAGLDVNFMPEYPVWSQKTFSGRSKTTKFNIQGFVESYTVTPPDWSEHSSLVHFDWICADIRVASLLSQDKRLLKAFDDSDPYIIMMNELNNGSDEKITRDESKRYLLKSINSMDFTSVALSEVYPRLGDWIRRCKEKSASDGGYLETILKRRFRRAHAKNELAVLNGVMQGSVAHAMQSVIRRIWERLPDRLIAEIHDSLIISAGNSKDIRAMIDIVTPIMLYPFQGILDSNPIFPLKVSIGKKWKTWQLFETHRKSGVTKHVSTN